MIKAIYTGRGRQMVASPSNSRRRQRPIYYGVLSRGDEVEVLALDARLRPDLFAPADAHPPAVTDDESPPADDIDQFNISQTAYDLAVEHSIDLTQIEGTGKDGRILIKDVENVLP